MNLFESDFTQVEFECEPAYQNREILWLFTSHAVLEAIHTNIYYLFIVTLVIYLFLCLKMQHEGQW